MSSPISTPDDEIAKIVHAMRNDGWNNGFNTDDQPWIDQIVALLRSKENSARKDELHEAFVRNAPAFADEIDVEKYWNDYYENRLAQLSQPQKGDVS